MSTAALAFSSMCERLKGIGWGPAGVQSNEINVLYVNRAPIHACSAPEVERQLHVISAFAVPEAVQGSDPLSLHAGGSPDHPCVLGHQSRRCSHPLHITLGGLREPYCNKALAINDG